MKLNKMALYIVAVIVVAAAGAAAYLMNSGKPVPYAKMPGFYQCKGFGLPDPTFSKLQITEEMKLVGHSSNKQFTVGRLAPREPGLELEYSMEVVHFSSFNLDPFTAPQLTVFDKYLSLTAKEGGKEFTAKCARVD